MTQPATTVSRLAARAALLVTPLFATLLPLLAVLPAALPAPALAATQGSGVMAAEARSVPEFQAIAISGPMDLVVRQGAAQAVQVQADDNLLPLLETVVESGAQGPTLKVRWSRGQSISTRSKVTVRVTVPRLTGLALAGSGDMRVENFSTPSLQVSVSGSGDARLEGLRADELGVRVAGSGDVAGQGSVGKLTVSIAGSGDVRLAEMVAEDVSISIAGSGDAAVNAQKALSVRIAGSGDVVYTGNPTLKRSVAGSGSVTKR